MAESRATEALARVGVVCCGGRRLMLGCSLEVLEGSVKPVDCVWCEWIESELLWALPMVVVDNALKTSCTGHRKR